MNAKISVDGRKVVDDVVRGMIDGMVRKESVEVGVNIEHTNQTKSEEIKEPTQKLDYHEYANIFPMCSDEERKRLFEDISRNGFREADKIDTLGGKLLDGRNRYEILLELGIFDPELHCKEYKGDAPLEYVFSKNFHRRHLDESQRAMVAAKFANLRHGGDRKNQTANLPLDNTPPITQAKAAEKLNVGERSVRDAKVVLNSGNEEVIEKVMSRTVPVSAAAKEIREATKDKPQSTEAANLDSAQPEQIASEWAQAAKTMWWHNPNKRLYRLLERAGGMKTPLEMVQYAIDDVQRAIDENVLGRLLTGLQEIQTLGLAGGTELTEEKIDTLFVASDASKDEEHPIQALKYILLTIEDVGKEVLQTWVRIQDSSNDWTPFDGLTQFKKGQIYPDDVAHTMIYVLRTAFVIDGKYKPGWSKERLIATVVSIVGDTTTEPITADTVDYVSSDCVCKEGEKKYKKRFRAVSKWLRDCKGIDIPEA